MSGRQEYERVYLASILFALVILAANTYYFAHPVLSGCGLTHPSLDYVIGRFRHSGIFASSNSTKFFAFILMVLSTIVRSGKGKKTDWKIVAGVTTVSCIVYFLPFFSPGWYLLTTLLGSIGVLVSSSMISRLYGGMKPHDNDILESFDQETEKLPTDYSINIPMQFYWKKQWHDGYVNVVNPFRGTMIMGLPGCGKSFSVFNPYIRQLIERGFTMMLYDFKMPDLSRAVYNELLKNTSAYVKVPRFYCIDFKNPRLSNRCNPIAPQYFTDIVDANETARVVMSALNKGNEKKDFFTDSAQQYFGTCLWELVTYTPPGGRRGDWCDMPHLIELINQDYTKVLGIVKRNKDLDSKAKVFIDALDANAQDQLQGQIASVRIPLNDIASPLLYWILSGNDFTLDINNPDEPKILCLGNDPKRQEVYGAALSLFTFRVIKLVNEPQRLPCALLIDELPTVKVEGLDGLMATARSNKVAVALGIQDLSQLVADYGEKTADKIVALPSNVFVGQVNGKTAERYSKEFGREFRRQEAQTVSIDSESLNISFHEEDVMPVRKISTLPSGTFIGRVAVDNDTKMKQNFFCARLKPEPFRGRMEPMPVQTDFHLETVLEDLRMPGVEQARMADRLADIIEKEWITRDDDATPWTLDDLLEERDRRMDKLSRDERDRILKDVIHEMEEEKIRKVMQENYDRIKADIAYLIETEFEADDESEVEEDEQ